VSVGNGGLDKLRLFLGWGVTVAWFVSLVADATLVRYDVPPTLHGLMLLVAGALFGPNITNRGRRDK
jgi:hypothetical protein